MSRTAATGLGAAILAAAGFAACNSPDTHVVQGQRYDAAGNCLEPTSSIDIIEGSDPGLGCMPTCVVTPTGVVYASTMCGAFPALDDTSGADPACAGALAALQAMVVCGGGDDGGDDATDAPPDAPVETPEDGQGDGGVPASDARGDSQEDQEAQEGSAAGG